MTHTPLPARRVAMYLDTYLSRELMAHVIEHCRELGAGLLCLAPPPHNLAVSRLEAHLGALTKAEVEWEIQGIECEHADPFRELDGVVLLVCESGSALARHRGALPAPLLVLLNPEPRTARHRAEPEPTVDWLAPRYNRGF